MKAEKLIYILVTMDESGVRVARRISRKECIKLYKEWYRQADENALVDGCHITASFERQCGIADELIVVSLKRIGD